MDFLPTMDDKEEGKEEARRRQQQILREEVWSWGAGTDGQLGTGKLEDEHLPHLLHLPFLSSDGPISMLACGGAHVIALTSSGKVLTWGRGTSGQLGHGDMANSLNPKSVKFLEEYMIIHVSAGWSHSGFVSDTGCLFTCGDGSFGQLGHGDYLSQRTPVKVSYFNGRHVQQIACGMRHSLVLLKDCSDNQVYAFGSGKRGQLGVSTDKIKSVSLPHVTCGLEGTKIVRISANGDHSAALSVDRHLYCWGRGFSGYFDASTPQHLSLSLQLIEVALGWNHALLLTGDGKVFMLGGSHHGALGDLEKMNPIKHYSDTSEAVLIQVFSLDSMRVVQIAAGAEHSALVTDGAIQTWGWGEHGQLGLGDASNQMNPQTVFLGHKVQDGEAIFRIYCGSGFTFAKEKSGPKRLVHRALFANALEMIRSAVVVRGNKGVTGTLAANAGDVRLRAVVGNAIFGTGAAVEVAGLSLSVEKPGFFLVDYDVPEQDVRFQFMNTVNVLEKQLNWTYTHSRNENRVVLDGTLVLDPANKVSASYELASRNRKLKYSYAHRGATLLEPCYDFGKNSWDLAASHRFDGDLVRASYETVSKNLRVEWSWKSSLSQEGRFKILASFNLSEGLHMPNLSAESSWNFEV